MLVKSRTHIKIAMINDFQLHANGQHCIIMLRKNKNWLRARCNGAALQQTQFATTSRVLARQSIEFSTMRAVCHSYRMQHSSYAQHSRLFRVSGIVGDAGRGSCCQL